jgi:uncharacterized membrane protein
MLELAARIAASYSLVVWLGGILHLAIAAIPQIRLLEDRQLRIFLTAGMMRRYNPYSWTALTMLTMSVLYLGLSKALAGVGVLAVAGIVLVVGLFAADFIHSFIYGPKAAGGDISARRKANILAISEIPPALALPAIIVLL